MCLRAPTALCGMRGLSPNVQHSDSSRENTSPGVTSRMELVLFQGELNSGAKAEPCSGSLWHIVVHPDPLEITWGMVRSHGLWVDSGQLSMAPAPPKPVSSLLGDDGRY